MAETAGYITQDEAQRAADEINGLLSAGNGREAARKALDLRDALRAAVPAKPELQPNLEKIERAIGQFVQAGVLDMRSAVGDGQGPPAAPTPVRPAGKAASKKAADKEAERAAVAVLGVFIAGVLLLIFFMFRSSAPDAPSFSAPAPAAAGDPSNPETSTQDYQEGYRDGVVAGRQAVDSMRDTQGVTGSSLDAVVDEYVRERRDQVYAPGKNVRGDGFVAGMKAGSKERLSERRSQLPQANAPTASPKPAGVAVGARLAVYGSFGDIAEKMSRDLRSAETAGISGGKRTAEFLQGLGWTKIDVARARMAMTAELVQSADRDRLRKQGHVDGPDQASVVPLSTKHEVALSRTLRDCRNLAVSLDAGDVAGLLKPTSRGDVGWLASGTPVLVLEIDDRPVNPEVNDEALTPVRVRVLDGPAKDLDGWTLRAWLDEGGH